MRTIIAVDEGDAVPVIVDFVLHHKWSDDAEFKILHVISPLMMDHPMASYPLFLESIAKESLEFGTNLVNKVKDELRAELKTHKIETEVIDGFPKEAIIQVASKWEADLIVVGSHGRTGLSRFLLGSVSGAVVSHAPCSVTIVRIPRTAHTAEDVRETTTSAKA
ncbi:MAG TPA: universal stress protein [Candidatus Obscuribacterales bacterium]